MNDKFTPAQPDTARIIQAIEMGVKMDLNTTLTPQNAAMLLKEITRLRNVEGDYEELRESHRQVMQEPCANDEQHCTCVPALREEIKRLNQELHNLNKAYEHERGENQRVRDALMPIFESEDPAEYVEKLRIQAHDADVKALERRNDELQAEVERLKHYEEYFYRVIDEPCPNDEQHCTCVPALRLEIDRLKEAQRWIPVGERLPEKNTTDLGEEYIVKLGGSYNIVCPMNYQDGEWYTGGWGTSRTRWNRVVTHWQPLPEPPKDGEE
jgi:uncharacterized small protein (DUF1192 family)